MRSEIPTRAPYASGSRASCAGPSAQRAEADDLVDFSLIALPGGWVRIAIEDNARARPDALDFLLLFESAKRELARVDLTVAGEMVAAHGGRILARPAMRS